MRLELRLLKRKFKFFFQRLIRGFDDSETWDLADTYYRWLEPRLKRFKEVTFAYPMRCKSMDKWKKELDKRCKQLQEINTIEDFEFSDWSYIPKKDFVKLMKKGIPNSTLCATAKEYAIQDFNKWFYKNVNELWW